MRREPEDGSNGLVALLAWSAVFGMNLVVPFEMGASETAHGGRIGMNLGVLALWGLGAMAVVHVPAIRITVLAGSLFVAFTQVFLVPQVVAGGFGIGMASVFGQVTSVPDAPTRMTELGGFIASVVTGVVLILLSLLVGLPAWFIVTARRHRHDW